MFSRRAMQEGAGRRNRMISQAPPTKGLNAKNSLAAMPMGYAPILENCLARPDGVVLRAGSAPHTTGFVSPVYGLWTWDGFSSSKLFATCDDGVFDATAAGAVGAAVASITNGKTRGVNFSTGAANYLILCNGTDSIQEYDGSSWATVASMGTLTTADVIAVETYKQRLFLVEKNSLSVWYLGTNAVSGTATEWSSAAIFRRGGYIQAIATWTVDAGNGPDDHLVLVTSAGEVGVFTGTDPGVAADWRLVGVYYLSAPLGNLALFKWGGDVLLLSESGVYPLSKALQTASIDRTRSLTEAIQPLLADLVETYRDNFGWQLLANPSVPFLLVNIPGAAGGVQYIMHAQSQAWSKITGWVANCWARFGNTVYFGGETEVTKGWTGTSDNGAPIRGRCMQAFSNLGSDRQKTIPMVQLTLTSEEPFAYLVGIASDYSLDPTQNQVWPNMTPAARWDQAVWDEDVWPGQSQYLKEWRAVADVPGEAKAFYLEFWSALSPVFFQRVDLLVRDMGTF